MKFMSTLCAMLVSYLVILAMLASQIESRSIVNTQYAIVFDGGSKGTRLNLFSYRKNDNSNGNLNYQQEVDINRELYCELNDDGLSTYQETTNIAKKFDKCLNQATQLIPASLVSKTPIVLGATAGLRLLEVRNRTLSEIILGNVRNYFRQTGYLFTDNSQVKILTGGEEGAYAWISANYLSNKLTPNTPNYPETTYGILDIGGSSAQVSFLARNDPLLDNYNLNYYFQNFHMNSASLSVYSMSYLCFGTTSILNMYYASQIRSQDYSNGQMKMSCLPEDATVTIKGEDLLDSPCTNGLMFGQDNSFTIDKSRVNPNDIFTLIGNAKKDKCRIEIASLISNSSCPYGDNKCSFNGIYMPSLSNFKFLALSNFYEAFDYTQRLYEVNLENNLQLFNQTTYTLCNMKYKNLQKLNEENKVGISNKRLVKLCVENVYIMKLFELYGFKSYADINIAEEINGKQTSWALGYLLYLINEN